MDKRARIDLVDGFLGAGKTTFIRRYAEYLRENGVSYAVLENEFGAAGVDARLLGGNVYELSGGCICCGQKVNFHNLLIELSGRAERVIVEPSGLFNADDFFDIMESPEVRAVADVGMMVTLVDPFSLSSMTQADRSVLFDEAISSGAILFSRTDRADGQLIARAKTFLHDLLGEDIPLLAAHTVDFAALMNLTPMRREHTRRTQDHSTLFQSALLRPQKPYSAEELRSKARRLLSGEAGSVLRVKGAVCAEGGGFLSLNAAADDIDIRSDSGPALINVIGRNMSRSRMKDILFSE